MVVVLRNLAAPIFLGAIFVASVAYADTVTDLLNALGNSSAPQVAFTSQQSSSSAVSLAAPTLGSTQSANNGLMQQQIVSLLAQVQQLKILLDQLKASKISALSASQASQSQTQTLNLVRDLSRGSHGEDVTSLQVFLISQGLLSADSATGYFGPVTEAAVQNFQTQNTIVSSGTPDSTGYGAVGPITRALLSSTFSNTSAGASSGQTFQSGVPPAWSQTPLPTNPPTTNTLPSNVNTFLTATATTVTASSIPTTATPIIGPHFVETSCTLSANPTSITAGQSVTLSWTSQNGAVTSISPIGVVVPSPIDPSFFGSRSGSRIASPQQTTFYVATVLGSTQIAYCSALVTVAALPTTAATTTVSLGTGRACVYNGVTYANGSDIVLNPAPMSMMLAPAHYQCGNGSVYTYGSPPLCVSGACQTSGGLTTGASCVVHRHCGDLLVPNDATAGNSKACGVTCAPPQQCVNGTFVQIGTYATPHQYETSCPDDPISL